MVAIKGIAIKTVKKEIKKTKPKQQVYCSNAVVPNILQILVFLIKMIQ